MYKVDPTLFEKFKSNLQTKSNNNDPNPLVYITRNRTPVTTQRFWEKVRVTATVGTRSSIAVRRPEGNLTGDVIFVAQVEDGNAVIRKAQPRINLTDMVWSHVTTLNNVSELSIMFDGYMKIVEGKVESYTTGDLPVVFYVDSDNSLKGWNMNTDVTFTISDTAYNVASVRGLYSEAADLNDGIFVFYTNASGELWEARVLNDEVTELTQITLKPDGVTGWEDVWASLTFDYRVVLQLKGDDGNTYSLLSASRPGGFALVEDVNYGVRLRQKFIAECGYICPNVVSIYNTENAPLMVFVDLDGPVEVFNGEFDRIWIEDANGTKHRAIYVVKTNNSQVRLTFNSSLSGSPGPHIINYDVVIGGCFGSIDMQSSLDMEVFLLNIDQRYQGVYYGITMPQLFTAELEKAFDGKMYSEETSNYPLLINQNITGTMLNIDFKNQYSEENVNYPLSINQEFTATQTNLEGVPI